MSDIQEQIKRTSILKINSAYSIKYTYVAFQIDVKYKNTGKNEAKNRFLSDVPHVTAHFRAPPAFEISHSRQDTRVDFKY